MTETSTTRSKEDEDDRGRLTASGIHRDTGGGKEEEDDEGRPLPPPRRLSYEHKEERGKVGRLTNANGKW